MGLSRWVVAIVVLEAMLVAPSIGGGDARAAAPAPGPVVASVRSGGHADGSAGARERGNARPRPRPTPPTSLPSARPGAHAITRWIVAARPGALADRDALAIGARPLEARLGLFIASEPAAARLVRLLQADGIFRYAEPDVRAVATALPADPLTPTQWWVPALVAPELSPPAPTGQLALAVSETGVDLTHPDLQGGYVTVAGTQTGDGRHGTAVTSVAVAAANGTGLVGLWPGAPTRVYLNEGTCGGAVKALAAAAVDRAPVINMSYGFPDGGCFSHFVATQFAFGLGTVLVASAGNDFEFGNPRVRPANDPHILTVAALQPTLGVAPFSNENNGIDLAAPGVGIPVALPIGLDTTDGLQDGFSQLDGTSFSSPLVAAATAWVRAVRPDLDAAQVFQLMRASAADIGSPGWDRSSGFGVVDLRAALAGPAPLDDPLEPNDDLEWIDGRHFRRDPALLYRRPAQVIVQRLDVEEDPIDVVAVWMPKRSRLRVDAVPISGNVDLEVFMRRAKTVYYRTRPRSLIAGSYRPGTRRDTLFIDNPGPGQIVYVTTFVPANDPFLDASYRLIVRRSRLPAVRR